MLREDGEDVMISFRFLLLIFIFILALLRTTAASDREQDPMLYKTVFGLFLHDRGPTSDRHEGGVDPNWELQFNPPDWTLWHWIGRPFPVAGITPNFKGHTSVLYAGVTYEFGLSNKFADALPAHHFTRNLFVAGGLSAALHNGPLHKDPVGCSERSDCGFGYRVLPRLNFELGTNFPNNHGVSFFYDHMSHKGVLPGENEGIDHIGFRYHYKFNKARP
jgi:lipid A 3-O-deacylase